MNWIKTSEKLPEIGQRCLVYRSGAVPKEEYDIMTYTKEIDRWFDTWEQKYNEEEFVYFQDVWGNKRDVEDIDYWIAIPEIPKC